MRKNGGAQNYTEAKILSLLKSGMSPRDVAQSCNCSVGIVARLKREGDLRAQQDATLKKMTAELLESLEPVYFGGLVEEESNKCGSSKEVGRC